MISIYGRDYLYKKDISEVFFWFSLPPKSDHNNYLANLFSDFIIDLVVGFIRLFVAKHTRKKPAKNPQNGHKNVSFSL